MFFSRGNLLKYTLLENALLKCACWSMPCWSMHTLKKQSGKKWKEPTKNYFVCFGYSTATATKQTLKLSVTVYAVVFVSTACARLTPNATPPRGSVSRPTQQQLELCAIRLVAWFLLTHSRRRLRAVAAAVILTHREYHRHPMYFPRSISTRANVGFEREGSWCKNQPPSPCHLRTLRACAMAFAPKYPITR